MKSDHSPPLQDATLSIAHLRHSTDEKPGITRKADNADNKDGWIYTDAHGKRVNDPGTLLRIKRLGIPPAYVDVWICPTTDGHLQATGRDARGRKQYRYHANWRTVRDASKYERMIAFGTALPKIRERVHADLARHGLPREKVLATLVYLLEKTCIRVGNDEYAHSNNSYGLTTLLHDHVHIRGSTLRFRFRGKSGKDHDIALADPAAARILRKLQELPGHELFEYLDHDGHAHRVHSEDVNAYLHEITGAHFTAKDFRTWAGTLYCAGYLAESEAARNEAHGKRVVADAIKRVSARLGNTPAICRKCYVHPAVIDAFQEGAKVLSRAVPHADLRPVKGFGLNADEAAVLKFLKSRMKK